MSLSTSFTPGWSLAGGALIGLAAGLLLLCDGQVAGVSGILGRALTPRRGDFAWRVAFLVGLPLGAAMVSAVTGPLHGFEITHTLALLVGGGLLVGFGTSLGSGCTSGHGVCGLARGSGRSLAATLTFMASGALTVFVVRHWLGIS
ncbi:MAG TPA: YeeE/YedE thiosulfate transporter family protein [Myxococcota bacterium]|nr:YeeE/YedE thiosulfate transporter family protein [Myxococcota bacterium]